MTNLFIKIINLASKYIGEYIKRSRIETYNGNNISQDMLLMHQFYHYYVDIWLSIT